MEYYTYGYPKNVPLIKEVCCGGADSEEIEAAVTNAIMSFMPTIENNFTAVNVHIDEAKDEILNSDCGCNCDGGCDNCCGVTKCDLCRAVEKINEHIDSKFEEVDFLGHFEDLNEQIRNLA